MKRKLALKKRRRSVKHKLDKHLKQDAKILKNHEIADKKLMKSIKAADSAERKRHKVSIKGMKSMCPKEHLKYYRKIKKRIRK